MKKLTTISDIGSVKIGIDGQFTLDVPNGYGDGDTAVIICDKDEYKPEDYALWASVRGNNINIYDMIAAMKSLKHFRANTAFMLPVIEAYSSIKAP